MKLSLGFSPCPNDTFIFDALIHHKIDTEGLDFEIVMDDVENLNKKAFDQTLDITKLSYAAYGFMSEFYVLSNSGSALGNKCGPLLVSKIKDHNLIDTAKIAIPGQYTTANFLFSFAFPNHNNKEALLFSEIEHAILDGRVDAGVIIHENRFTYQEKGLFKLLDLGEFWEDETGFPIPLGGIAINRNLDLEIQKKVQRLIRKSIEFAFENPLDSMDFTKLNAQELDDTVIKSHISLYVNDFSIDLGEKGRSAVHFLLQKMIDFKIIKSLKLPLFVD
jgi:1,4-dihydroxy-6-naphthoate synthase